MNNRKILPGTFETKGYCAVRQFSDGTQYIDWRTYATTPANCEVLAHPHIVPTAEEQSRDSLAPIVGYVRLHSEITERVSGA